MSEWNPYDLNKVAKVDEYIKRFNDGQNIFRRESVSKLIEEIERLKKDVKWRDGMLEQMANETGREITRLRSELQQERESHRWISVEERLPENEIAVMCFDLDESVCLGWFRASENTWYTTWGEDEVTHWQPLPSSPEKDKE